MSVCSVQAPAFEEVAELMGGLFDLEIKSSSPITSDVYSIAEYTNEAGAVVGYVACDLAGGCRLGAALTQVPAGRADEAIKEGVIPDSLAENLNEVLNISVNLIVPDDGSRLVLNRTVHGANAGDFAAMKEGIDSRTQSEFCFEIARYGACRMIVAG